MLSSALAHALERARARFGFEVDIVDRDGRSRWTRSSRGLANKRKWSALTERRGAPSQAGVEVRRRIGDRRSRPRFEIVGELFGTIEATLDLVVKNVSVGGCLIESPVPVAPDSMHHVTIRWDGRQVPVEVRVRHVRPSHRVGRAPTYTVGLEFTSITRPLAEQFAAWATTADGLGD